MRDEELPSPLSEGQVLEGKYQVGRLLGGGAMGVVYEANHLLLQKAVAIKVLRPELAGVDDVRDRFEGEARAAAAIGHPNIVAVTDMGRTPQDALYFVMDRLRGETLGERLVRVRRLELSAALAVAGDVLAGLAAAHALGLVHRDLKPDNVFLARPPGGGEIAKVLDFGIAKALASVGRRSNATRVGLTVGTPMYMAPEQAVGASDIDHRADLYSMAVMLYEMLAGRRPFDGTDAISVLAAVMTATPPRLAELCPELPPAVARVVEGAMSRDKTQRPASATELLTSLRKAATEAAPPPRLAGATALHGGALDELGPQARVGPDPLGAPVLTDLTGNDDAARSRLDRLYPPLAAPSWAETSAPAPAPELQLATPAAPAPEPAPPPPSRRRPLLLALPIAAVAVAAAVVVPRLGGPGARVAPAGPPMALVQFDVTPSGSRVTVDGVPITSNPMPLRADIAHTIQAEADGYELYYYKGQVRDGVPVTCKLRRKR